jgi:hypothetical protein
MDQLTKKWIEYTALKHWGSFAKAVCTRRETFSFCEKVQNDVQIDDEFQKVFLTELAKHIQQNLLVKIQLNVNFHKLADNVICFYMSMNYNPPNVTPPQPSPVQPQVAAPAEIPKLEENN